MAREKGMGSLQQEKSGRWTMRVGINGKRYCRSTRTKDRDKAERILQRFLAPFGLGERRLPLADVWNAYVMSSDRNDLAPATLNSKRVVWMHFARWMEHYYLPQKTRRHHQRLVTIPIHPTLGQALIGRDEAVASTLTRHLVASSGAVLSAIAEMYNRARWQVNHELSRIFHKANITTSIRIDGRKGRTPEATFHSLRHNFVSFAANAGVPLHIVQSIVGHESAAMTRHYYHESVDALRSAVNAIPALG